MGNNSSKKPRSQMMAMAMTCSDDLMCQNIDSRRSIPGQAPVLVCPNAKCVSGSCECGTKCQKDPYTGMCCTRVEEQLFMTPMGEERTTFCIEEPSSEEPSEPVGVLEFFSKKKW